MYSQTLIIESGLHLEPNFFGLRQIRASRFANTFILSEWCMIGTPDINRYVIMDKDTGVILIIARTIMGAIIKLIEFLADKEQFDLDTYIIIQNE